MLRGLEVECFWGGDFQKNAPKRKGRSPWVLVRLMRGSAQYINQ